VTRQIFVGQRQVNLSGIAAVELDAARVARDSDYLPGGSVRDEFPLIVEPLVNRP
jgi:hypothetical protein